VRALATTGQQRSRYLPDVPTIAEGGLKDVVVESWWGVFAPIKTPEDILNRTACYINSAMQRKDTQDSFAAVGMEMLQLSRKQFEDKIRADIVRWGPIVKSSGFKAEE
jgi:tripartite-type tricarboxylate transporter receptor subunit TctC